MSNEIDDFILADSISTPYGGPKRNKAINLGQRGRRRVECFEDFENGIDGTKFNSYLNGTCTVTKLFASPTSTCARLNLVGAAGQRLAIHMLSNPTAASGLLCYASTGKIVWECRIAVNTLATVAEDYELHVGLMDRADALEGNLIGFIYQRSVSTQWRYTTKKGGTATINNSGVTVTTGFVILRAEVNAAGTSVDFYINGTKVASSVTTNIPNTAFNVVSPVVVAYTSASAGAITKTFDVDYFYYDVQLTTPR